MEAVAITVLGAGSVRSMPHVIGSLATYFGERPLDIRFWDADEERLDLFDRFARLCFAANRNTHSLRASCDAGEMLVGAEIIIVLVETNCAQKFMRQLRGKGYWGSDEAAIDSSLENLCPLFHDACVLNLLPERVELPVDVFYRLDWPNDMPDEEQRAWPFRILRYLHEEEYLHEFFKEHERTPLKEWLNDPSTGRIVQAT